MLRVGARGELLLVAHLFFNEEKKDSATASSWQLPVRLHDSLTSFTSVQPANDFEVYRLPRSMWKTAFSATYPRPLAVSNADITSRVCMLSFSAQPTMFLSRLK